LNPPEAQMGKKRWGFLMGKTLGKLWISSFLIEKKSLVTHIYNHTHT
jgi:hypothetical protein